MSRASKKQTYLSRKELLQTKNMADKADVRFNLPAFQCFDKENYDPISVSGCGYVYGTYPGLGGAGLVGVTVPPMLSVK